MLSASEIGFHCRSWVIWYYTFGVNCKYKFSRSHTHLFHFVKDPKNFTFNDEAIARPLRAAAGLCRRSRPIPRPVAGRHLDPAAAGLPDGFHAGGRHLVLPARRGTFKERAGFHGCQMPEQLLGRIIKVCSNPGDLVLDPFSGSATTLASPRNWAGGLSVSTSVKNTSSRGLSRLSACETGDPLDGSPEPTVSAPSTPTDGIEKGSPQRRRRDPGLKSKR